MVGLAGGIAFGLANMLVFGNTYGFAEQLVDGIMGGLLFGLPFGLVYGMVNVVVSALGDSLDPHASNPWMLLIRDRTVTLVRIIASVLASGLGSALVAVGLIMVLTADPASKGMVLAIALMAGIPVGLMAGMVRLALSAWGSWLISVHLWLPLTGRLPWRPKCFLEDAYDRGILRQSGAAYQFRHAQLRDHLVDHYRKTHPHDSTAPRNDPQS